MATLRLERLPLAVGEPMYSQHHMVEAGKSLPLLRLTSGSAIYMYAKKMSQERQSLVTEELLLKVLAIFGRMVTGHSVQDHNIIALLACRGVY